MVVSQGPSTGLASGRAPLPESGPNPHFLYLQVASEFFIDFDKRNKELLAAFFFPKVRRNTKRSSDPCEVSCKE